MPLLENIRDVFRASVWVLSSCYGFFFGFFFAGGVHRVGPRYSSTGLRSHTWVTKSAFSALQLAGSQQRHKQEFNEG